MNWADSPLLGRNTASRKSTRLPTLESKETWPRAKPWLLPPWRKGVSAERKGAWLPPPFYIRSYIKIK